MQLTARGTAMTGRFADDGADPSVRARRAAQHAATVWRVETLLRLADGSAWAEAVEQYAGTPFDSRLEEMVRIAGRSRAAVMDNVHLFLDWQAGSALVGPDGRVLEVNLKEHAERVERAMQRNRLEKPQPPRAVLDRGAF